jgi:carboxyl-terminal processing protease
MQKIVVPLFGSVFLAICTFTVGCTASKYKSYKTLSPYQYNFEVFWHEFEDNYAFFTEKGVNWKEKYDFYSKKINKNTTETEFVGIVSEMLTPLADGHISLTKGEERLFKGESKHNYFKNEFKGIEKEFWTTVEKQLQSKDFGAQIPLGTVLKEKPFLYYSQSKTLGYIHITRFFDGIKGVMGSDKDEKNDEVAMLKNLDIALANLENTKGIIIDLRDNGGGHSGYEMAGKFSDETILTHYKKIKKDGKFSEPQAFFLKPTLGKRFLKPIVLLTSDRTASAAEDFALSLSLSKHVTIIGTHTKGMFSDMYNVKLPNKMELTLSNQCYLNVKNEPLEDVGVIPKIVLQNSKKDIENNADPLIVAAIVQLNK